MKKLLLTLFILCVNLFAHSQTTDWSQIYGDAAANRFNSIIQTQDGGYLMVGSSTRDGGSDLDFYFVKISSDGGTNWSLKFGTENYDDVVLSIVQAKDNSGDFVFTGYSSTDIYKQIYVGRMDDDGNIIWEHTYSNDADAIGYSIVNTNDNGFALCGFSVDNNTKHITILKYDASGELLWNKIFNGDNDDIGYALAEAEDGTLNVTGSTKSYSENENDDVYLLKVSSEGDSLWFKHYGWAGNEVAKSLIIDENSYLIAAGYTDSKGAGGKDCLIIKFSDDGDTIITNVVGTAYDETANSICAQPNGFFIGGTSLNQESNESDFYTIGLNTWCDTLWTAKYDIDAVDEGNCCVLNGDNNFIVCGNVNTDESWNGVAVSIRKCSYIYPRAMWINNMWCRSATCNGMPNILDVDSLMWQRENDLIKVARNSRMSELVFSKLEELMIEDDPTSHDPRNGNVMRDSLAKFMTRLYKSGIPIATAKIRSEDDEDSIASTTNTLNLLGKVRKFNQNVAHVTKFKKILLDYEYWDAYYGCNKDSASKSVFTKESRVKHGWNQFRILCDSMVATRNNSANNIKGTDVYVNSLKNDIDSSGTITTSDYQKQADSIDVDGFDAVVLVFYVADQTSTHGNITQWYPDRFLTTTPHPDLAERLFKYFGSNGITTNFTAIFSAEDSVGPSANADNNYLNDMMIGNPSLSGKSWFGSPKYVPQIENTFIDQYNDSLSNVTDSTHSWKSVKLNGFQWFKYYENIFDTTRTGDSHPNFYIRCPYTERYTYSTVDETSSVNSKLNFICINNPTRSFILIRSNEKFEIHQQIKIYDIVGKDVSKLINLQKEDETNIQVDCTLLNAGIYFISIQNSNRFNVLKFIKL